jgi:uncharacterized protein (UPF0261 family)
MATLDTKGHEAAYLAQRLRELGARPWIVDIGLRGEPSVLADLGREAVLASADATDGTTGTDEREQAMTRMAAGAGRQLQTLHAAGRLAGVVAIGGSKGTWMATTAMRALPWGVPKLMVASTVAGDLRRYTGHRDIAFLPTVVDLAGLNDMTRLQLARGAAALYGMVGVPTPSVAMRGVVGMSMAGVVTPLATRVQAGLAERGLETVVFPANGAGGLALEEAIEAGRFSAIVDLALLEIGNHLLGGICSAGPDRLSASAGSGLPQVVVPGAVEFANFAEPSTVPGGLRDRVLVEHTPAITLVRLTAAESAEVGRTIGERLSRSAGPVEVLVPLRGFSAYDRSGGPFEDPTADAAFRAALGESVGKSVALRELDLHVNDPDFAAEVLAAAGRIIPHKVAA